MMLYKSMNICASQMDTSKERNEWDSFFLNFVYLVVQRNEKVNVSGWTHLSLSPRNIHYNVSV
jgi:hypothetical protein